MVKKHLPPLEELLLTLKKCVQDHKVMPFHRIEELKETVEKIRLIKPDSGHLLLTDYDKNLLMDAENIIEEFETLNDPHKDCDINYECEDYANDHDIGTWDYE